MDTPAQKIYQYFKENPPRFDSAESILDFLYWQYSEFNPIDNDLIRRQFETIRCTLSLPPDQYDMVFSQICDICISHGRLGFIEGMRFGIVLMQELAE